MYTNGSLLDDNKIKILLLLLDELYIDNYSPSYTNATKKALAFIELYPEYSNKLFINMTRVDAKRTTRAGQANNRLPVDFIKSPCIYPFHQLMVRSDGKVSQCCNDALALTAMGDLTNQTIMEVWNGEPFQKMRENMLNGRHCISTCSGCDVLLVYPDILKKIRSILKSSDGSMVEK